METRRYLVFTEFLLNEAELDFEFTAPLDRGGALRPACSSLWQLSVHLLVFFSVDKTGRWAHQSVLPPPPPPDNDTKKKSVSSFFLRNSDCPNRQSSRCKWAVKFDEPRTGLLGFTGFYWSRATCSDSWDRFLGFFFTLGCEMKTKRRLWAVSVSRTRWKKKNTEKQWNGHNHWPKWTRRKKNGRKRNTKESKKPEKSMMASQEKMNRKGNEKTIVRKMGAFERKKNSKIARWKPSLFKLQPCEYWKADHFHPQVIGNSAKPIRGQITLFSARYESPILGN